MAESDHPKAKARGAATSNHPRHRAPLTKVLLAGGEEPDPRFTLANERTFLAWTRTSLAFLAGGIGLDAFQIPGMTRQAQVLTAGLAICVGLIIALGAAVRWLRVERAMRRSEPLPVPYIVPFLCMACVIAALVLLVAL